jgi:5-methylcytosine-specific restriction endonuclease McrA
VKREEIFARDAYQCVYCGLAYPPGELSVDHVQPRVLGGDRSGGNLVTACGPCNVRKGHRTVAAFLADEPAALLNFRRLARTCGRGICGRWRRSSGSVRGERRGSRG